MSSLQILVQPALVAGLVLAKDVDNVLYDRFSPDNIHVWVDIATNVAAKLVSQLVVQDFIVPELGTMALAVEPLLHGSINGGVKSMFIDVDAINSLSFISTGVEIVAGEERRHPPPCQNIIPLKMGLLKVGYNAASIGGGMAIGMIF